MYPLLRALIVCILLVTQGTALGQSGAMTCPDQKTHLLSTFERGISSIRGRITEVESTVILSPQTKANFTQEGEWLIAWMEDQSERIAGLPDCAELPSLAENALLQVYPVLRLSRKIDATLLLWEVDRLSEHVRAALTPSSIDAAMQQDLSEALTRLTDARVIFLTLSEEPGEVSAFRPTLRRAIFLIRQGLRMMRFHTASQ